MNQLYSSNLGPGNRQSLRPYPQYTGVTGLLNDGNSIYHSLQAKLERRWKNGLLVQAAYTFSKLLNDVDGPSRANAASPQDDYNLRADRGVGGYDVPQRFVSSFVHQVPFGRREKYLNNVVILKDVITGWQQVPFGRREKYLNNVVILKDVITGWQMSGITEFQIGLPMTVTQSFTAWGPSIQRPNLVAGQTASLPRGDRTILHWFNTSAFAASPQYTLGFAPRFPLHAQFNNPGTNLSSLNSFGIISGARDARVVELALRIFF
ncbi:MAG: hypothetical protein NTY38_08000 [Acidobacteria bacterium]|nr:hypothetical protein [Acidobacteriota bacterium]